MYSAKIVLDSYVDITDARCTTLEFTMPKWLVAEFNTHRMIAKNSASSRAIPTTKLIQMVEQNPVYPIDFREKNTGMVAENVVSEENLQLLHAEWYGASRDMLARVKRMLAIGKGVDKQRVNRLLEPFMWTTVVATATEWDNFFNLRDHGAAQPEFGLVASIANQLYKTSEPQLLQASEWHLPYFTDDEVEEQIVGNGMSPFMVALASAARVSRVTYVKQDTKYSFEEEVAKGVKLAKDRHMSPLDQVAMATHSRNFFGHSYSFKPLRKFIVGESGSRRHGNWQDNAINAFIERGVDYFDGY